MTTTQERTRPFTVAGFSRAGLFLAGLLTLVSVSPADAQLKINSDAEPVTVEAENGIEWVSDQNLYIARGNAKATRGALSVAGETLTALYRENEDEETEIYRLEALGQVVITSPNRTAYGDRAIYDLDQAVAVVLGGKPRMVTAEQTITASESLEYWEKRRIAVARGDAVAIQGTRKIRADALTAFFEAKRDGTLEVVRMDAVGHVVITTPREVARGNEGVYNVRKGIATLSGDVKITRGDTQLNGSIAEVNFKTGISRLLSSGKSKSTGRVRGLFSPKKKTDKK
jgi:lipopolysaccharide export system protein LptA